ncbi:MAG TPA: FUSC family protein [Pseudonocardiaceae bacterium]|nr:FUSC family protein [Pseudonocardiaceae bacterium]
MGSMLIGLVAGLTLARAEHLVPGTVVLATMVGLSLGRRPPSANWPERAAGLVLVPLVAAGASALSGSLDGPFAVLGSTVFVLALSATVWVRRFGPMATRLGTLAVLPLLSLLFAPAGSPLWTGITAAIVYLLVSGIQLLVGLSPAASSQRSSATVSTKLAVQLAAALTAAFVAGRLIWPQHWQWVVLTAFIVCAGNRGRGDVVHKSVLRMLGAAAGTLAATGLFAIATPSGIGGVAAILVVLIAGVVLRPVSYAYWAACVTAAMALLLGLLGQNPTELLLTRLAAIAVGGVLGVAASWLILPIRSRDVARARIAATRKAIERFRLDNDESARDAVRQAIAQLDLIAPAFNAHRRLHRLLPGSRRDRRFVADAFDELRAEFSRVDHAGSR